VAKIEKRDRERKQFYIIVASISNSVLTDQDDVSR